MTAKEEPAWQIRPESAQDAPLIEALNKASFGPGRYAKSAVSLTRRRFSRSPA